MGNILDNAIEAALKCENEKYILLNMKYDQGTFLISLKNSYNGNSKKSNGKFLTTKVDNKNHGIGLKSVESIVQKYSGKMKISHNQNEFEIMIMLIV